MTTKICTWILIVTVSLIPLSNGDMGLVEKAIALEERRSEILQASDGLTGDEATKNAAMVYAISVQQGELLLTLARKLHAAGNFDGEESAIGELIAAETRVLEMEKLITDIESRKLPKNDLPLALISLKRSVDIWKQRAIEEGVFMMSVERVKRDFREFNVEESEFAKRVQKKIDAAVESDDPICADPRHVYIFAEKTNEEIQSEKAMKNIKIIPNIKSP